jgi:hypothetical protein
LCPIPGFTTLVGGQWLHAQSGKTILNLNPANRRDVTGALRVVFRQHSECGNAPATIYGYR